MIHLSPWTLVFQTINFLILVWLLHRLLFKPVRAIVAERQAEARKDLDAVAAHEAAAKALREQVEGERKALERERETLRQSVHAELQRERTKLLEEAEREAEAIQSAARAELEAERRDAIDGLHDLAVDLGARIASKLLGGVAASTGLEGFLLRLEAHFAALPPPERERLVAEIGSARVPLEVVTAFPLSSEEQGHWKDHLGAMIGCDVDAVFRADSALIAGVELHFPYSVVRLTWADELEAIRHELKHEHAA